MLPTRPDWVPEPAGGPAAVVVVPAGASERALMVAVVLALAEAA